MSDRALSVSSLLFAIVIVVVHGLLLAPWMLDDAFIFFRYAEHWAEGHGIVWNIGEGPVEGCTSFLWLALLAAAHALGANVVDASLVLGHAVLFAALLLVHQSHRLVPAIEVRTAALATLFLGTCSAFTTWARSGMETGLQAMLLAALMVGYLRALARPAGRLQFVVLGLLCAALGMNRPDGLVLVAVIGLHALGSTRVLTWRGVGTTLLVFLVVFGGFYAWRWSYFGYPFPNTFYAKVGASEAQVWRGLDYLLDSAVILAPLLLALPIMSASGWRANRNLVVLLLVVLVYTGVIVAVGGDVMPAQRFFTPILPALCLLAAASVRSLIRPVRPLATLLVVGYGLTMMFTANLELIRADVVAYNGRIAGEWLQKHAPPGSTVAANAAGTVVYYSRLRAIDMLGLNDLHIARVEVEGMGSGHAGHEKGDGDYVLAQNPEFIQLGSSLGWVPTKVLPLPPFLSGRQLWANKKFRQGYKLVYSEGPTVWPGGNKCGYFGFYVRADIYEQMPKVK